MKGSALRRDELEQFRDWLGERLGLRFEEHHLHDLAVAAEARMRERACADFEAYAALLASDTSNRETRLLASHVTIGETYFFRQSDHFRALTEVVLPSLRAARPPGARLRVLSAGCASGEEAYTLSIALRAADSNIAVHAVDVNPAALQRARQARYSSWSLRETSGALQEQYFKRDGRDFVLDPAVSTTVIFEERNLLDDDPRFWHEGAFDVIFCRNVVMYFKPQVVTEVIARFARALRPDGFLFLGAAETLRGVSRDFRLQQAADCFYYQRAESGACQETLHVLPPIVIEVSEPLDLDASWVETISRSAHRIAELTAQPPAAAPPARADLETVRALVAQERVSEALSHLQGLPPHARQDRDLQLLHAAILTNGGRLEEARALLTHLQALDDLNAGVHYLLGLCCEHAGEIEDALSHHETAIYLDAEFAMPHLNAALLARRRGDLERARRELGLARDLLAREDGARILLFGGGFSRDTLIGVCEGALAGL